VANRDLLRAFIGKAEVWQVFDHRGVQLDALCVDELQHGGRRKGLRDGSKVEERTRRHRASGLRICDAITFGEQHLSVPDDPDGDPRHLVSVQEAADGLIQCGAKLGRLCGLSLLRHDGDRKSAVRSDERDDEQEAKMVAHDDSSRGERGMESEDENALAESPWETAAGSFVKVGGSE